MEIFYRERALRVEGLPIVAAPFVNARRETSRRLAERA
jgi:hypothetical protein